LVEIKREAKQIRHYSVNFISNITFMAKLTPEIVEVLRKTASKIEKSQSYQWGHMGLCNCGFLAQEVTQLSKAEIHTRAMVGHGDWSEQLNDYCPTSGLPMDGLIAELISFGFDSDDLKHLERLSDGNILRMLPIDQRDLKHNLKSDVVKYIRTWATMLEDELLSMIKIEELEEEMV
jgi:hypothetical protein